MFQYDFMRHAFISGTFTAVMCGFIGVYVVARGLSFISHALSHVGFTGAAFSLYTGLDPLTGMLLFNCAAALAIGQMGVKFLRRDVVISVILSVALGLGFLFISESSSEAATILSSLLFGSLVGISAADVWKIAVLSIIVLIVLILGLRVLTFDSFDPVGAQAANVPVRLVSIGFLVLIAITTAEAVQIVGALLVFTLTTCPAATARHITKSIAGMIVTSAIIGVIGVWLGLILGYYTNAPVSFFIAAIEACCYFAAMAYESLRNKREQKYWVSAPN